MSATVWSDTWIEPEPRSAPAAALHVLVVDEHEVVGWGFRLLLGRRLWVERCVTARDAADALELSRRQPPDLVLADADLVHRTRLARRLSGIAPGARIILTSPSGRATAADARALGAHGIVSTAGSARDLVRAVEQAAAGLLPQDEESLRGGDGPALSRREHEILELMSEGETNREIAARLFLSPYTVKQHTTAVYRKLGVRNRTEAAQRARRLGLIA